MLRRTNEYKVKVHHHQFDYITPQEKIDEILISNKELIFEYVIDHAQICFIIVKQFAIHSYFLWDFIVDFKYQNQGYGTSILKQLIYCLSKEYNAKIITTTCKKNNTVAIEFFKKNAFAITSFSEEAEEINLELKI